MQDFFLQRLHHRLPRRRAIRRAKISRSNEDQAPRVEDEITMLLCAIALREKFLLSLCAACANLAICLHVFMNPARGWLRNGRSWRSTRITNSSTTAWLAAFLD